MQFLRRKFMQFVPRRHIQRQRQQLAGPPHIECVFGELADIAFDDHHVLRCISRSLGILSAVAHPDLMDPDVRFFRHVPNLARQQQEHAHGFAPSSRRHAGAFAHGGDGANRRAKAYLAPAPSERDGAVDRAAVGIQYDGGSVKVAAVGEFFEVLRGVAGDNSDRADPAPAVRLACYPCKLHRRITLFVHGSAISGSTDRGHHSWKNDANGTGMKQRGPAGTKTGLATAFQSIFAEYASDPDSARPVHTLAIRRNCDRRPGLTLLFANCRKSDARRMHSRSCFRVYSESGIVHHLEQLMSNHCMASVDLSVVYATDGNR